MSRLAIIPARGGSKRIPRKNIKEFLGKPIISYSIDLAKKSNLFDEIMVSTDDKHISKISQKFGVNVPFMRSAQNSTDYATTMDVVKEVEGWYDLHQKRKFDYICCIYPAAPLATISDIMKGLDLIEEYGFETVFPVLSFTHPVYRGIELNENRVNPLYPENANFRTQDLKKIYHDAGQWYWIKCPIISDKLMTNNSGAIILDKLQAQDIDEIEDWKIAEIKYQIRHND